MANKNDDTGRGFIHKLEVQYGFDGIYYLRDIKYVIRTIRKIARDLPSRKNDIDWLQLYIESFLILNSRFYDNLAVQLVKNIRKYQTLPKKYTIKTILESYSDTLSAKYHSEASSYRHSVAHASNHRRVGVPEFRNDILPKPLSYRVTMGVALANMCSRKDLIKMWVSDMNESADNLEATINAIIISLNQYKNLPPIDPHRSTSFSGLRIDNLLNELKELSEKYESQGPMNSLPKEEADQIEVLFNDEKEAIFDKYKI